MKPKTQKQIQQVSFNKVWRWFVRDGHGQSVDSQGNYRYRGLDGCRCGIGVLIPNRLYTPALETKPVDTVMDAANEELKALLQSNGKEFLRDVQKAHDGLGPYTFSADIADMLRYVAKAHGLTIPATR